MTVSCRCPDCATVYARLGLHPPEPAPAGEPLPPADLVAALTERLHHPVPRAWANEIQDETNRMALARARSRQAREAEQAQRERNGAYLRTVLASMPATITTAAPAQLEPPATCPPWPPAMEIR